MTNNASTMARQLRRDAMPEAELRARIVNFALGILLVVIAALCAANLYDWLTHRDVSSLIYIAADLVAGALVAGLWALNRRGLTRWAALAYVALICLGSTAGFPPQTLDRLLAFYAVPIMLASLILWPSASFLTALFCGLSYSLVFSLHRSNASYDGLGILSLFVVALLAWRVALLLQDESRRRRQTEEQLRLDEARLQSLLDISQYKASDDQDLLDYALQELINLTGSELGYIYRYDEDRALFTLISWSKDVMRACAVQDPQTVYELDKTGYWGEVVRQRKPVIVNDYRAPSPLKKGYPAGHVELYRFMTVPVFAHERIVAVAGVANKDSDYDDADVRQCTLLLDTVWSIAERKRAEQALREKTAELERYFDTALDLYCIADTDGHFRRLNKAWEEMLGYPLAELEGQRFFHYVHPDDQDATRQALAHLSTQQPLLNFVNRYRCRDGSYRWIEWRATPSDQMIYAAARDITERIKAEGNRLEMERHLQQAQRLESLGVLAGGIAHDFNNLLMAILGYAGLALNDAPTASPMRDCLQGIERAARRGADLTRQMLTYAGRAPYVLQDMDLQQLVEEMANLLSMSINKRVTLKLNPKPGLPLIRADASQIQQIVMNLIINASEAIGENDGTITVTTDTMDCAVDYVRRVAETEDLRPGRYVVLEVADDGRGMDTDTQKRIFEPFFTTKFTGRGLGLATVQGIVRAHKGMLELRSELGRGTTFRVLLPALEAAAESTPAGNAEGDWRADGTILLVDDEEAVRDVGERMLRHQGFGVLTAADGQEALEVYRARGQEISAVVLDMTMPHMDGPETFRALRNLDPNARIILSSGYSDDVAESFADQGLAGFIHKPYSLANLNTVLQRAIEAGKPKGA